LDEVILSTHDISLNLNKVKSDRKGEYVESDLL
jgi:hypothetical protein